jgi:hypothetical protein
VGKTGAPAAGDIHPTRSNSAHSTGEWVFTSVCRAWEKILRQRADGFMPAVGNWQAIATYDGRH